MKPFCVNRVLLSKECDEELYLELLQAVEDHKIGEFSKYMEVSEDHQFMGVCLNKLFIHNQPNQFRHNVVGFDQAMEYLRQ